MTLCNSSLSDKVSSEGTIEVPKFEALEPRLLLDGSAPVFATPLEDTYVITDSTLTIGIDGYDADAGDVITFSAVSDNPNLRIYIPTGRSAILHFTDSSGTPIGDIVVVLFEDLSKAATDRFIALAQHNYDENGDVIEGADSYYTDVIVHRVIADFMIQTGDAENGDGTGGSTLSVFDDYFSPLLNFSGSGVLAMANSGANTNDSQFFITAGPTTWLNQVHMIFGQMISGQDVYDTIINSPSYPADDPDYPNRPYDPPVLSSIDIVPSDQDAAVIFQAVDNFAGDVNVTITMTDSQGNVTSKGIVVSVDRDVNLWHVTPGVEQTFTVDLTKLSDPKIKCSDDNVAVKLDIDAGTVTIKTPEAYIGFFKLTLSDGDTTSREIFVASQELSDPQVLNQTSTGTENIYCTLWAGNLLYVGRATGSSGYGSIGIYDISDMNYIVSVAEITNVFNTVVDLKLNGDTLVVIDYNPDDVTGRISTVDVSDPYNPVAIAYCTSTFVPWGLEISGDYAFVADRTGELTAYDVSDPENIQQVGSFNTLPNDKHLNDAYDVAIKGNYAYLSGNVANAVASGAKIGQVFVVDISDPKNMQYIKSIIGGAPVGLDVKGNSLYVADQYSSLRVYDITNPASPLYAGALGLPGTPIYVDVEGNSAVVTCGSMFTLVDVTNPSALTISYVFNNAYKDSAGYSTQCTKPVMLNGVAVVPAFNGGLTLIDASDADNTRWFTGSLKYLDDGATVTITVTGGTARIVTAGHLSGKIKSMDVYGDAKTTVSITTKKGKTSIDDLAVHSTIKSFIAKTTDITGYFTADGAISTLSLGDVTGEIELHMNNDLIVGSKTSMSITLGQVIDCRLDTNGVAVKSLTVGSWLDQDGSANDTITAPQISTLKVNGDFGASLTVGQAGAIESVMGRVAISGNVTGGKWTITGDSGGIYIAGDAVNLTVLASGDIARITLGASHGSHFLAGFAADYAKTNPDAASEFDVDLLATIGSVTIKGIKLPKGATIPRFVDDTTFSAARIGAVKLTNVDFTTNDVGLYARSTESPNDIMSVVVSDTDPAKKRNALYNWSWTENKLPDKPDMIHLLV